MNRPLMFLSMAGLCLSAAVAQADAPQPRRSFFSLFATRAPLDRIASLDKRDVAPLPPGRLASAERALDGESAPMPSAGEGQTIPLYHCVKYEDLHNIHPCAITKIVLVADPCHDPRSCCPPKKVAVQICVPPCGCLEIEHSRRGMKVEYDYGKYEVEIKSRRGVVVVNYDD